MVKALFDHPVVTEKRTNMAAFSFGHVLALFIAWSVGYYLWKPWEENSVVLHENYSFHRYTYVKEFDMHCSTYRHLQTGAQVISIRAPGDSNKVFGIAFRTPPPDSTGVAHVLEHSVLCGSDK